MARSTKKPEERRLEIIRTAQRLFAENGYAQTSVDAIIGEMGVAKGTFYYYFRSKPDVLAAIVELTLSQILEMAEQVADHPDLSALAKLEMLLAGAQVGDAESLAVAEHLHRPENRELHEISNVQTVVKLSPILAQVVAQGVDEGVFSVAHPLETIQLILTGSQFLLDGDLFDYGAEKVRRQRAALQDLVEKALGAAPGSFHFLNPEQ